MLDETESCSRFLEDVVRICWLNENVGFYIKSYSLFVQDLGRDSRKNFFRIYQVVLRVS